MKGAAKEKGLRAFSIVDPANIVKHLSYDGTQVAVNSRRSNPSRQSSNPSREVARRVGAVATSTFARLVEAQVILMEIAPTWIGSDLRLKNEAILSTPPEMRSSLSPWMYSQGLILLILLVAMTTTPLSPLSFLPPEVVRHVVTMTPFPW